MRKTLKRIHKSESNKATFLRFASVGATISIVDIVVFYLLSALDFSPLLARALSLTASMTVGYFLNRYFTFHHLATGRELWHSLARHFSTHAIGALLNLATFKCVILLAIQLTESPTLSPWIPLLGIWIGGMIGMCVNFLLSKKLVFDN